MTRQTTVDLIRKERMVAIIRLDDLSNAVDLSRALLSAGVRVQEFTLSNPAALDAVDRVFQAVEEFSDESAALGIGSVRTVEQARAAVEAQVDFVVTPIFQPGVLQICVEAEVPILCGAYTPTEIASAQAFGASMVKVFPARNLGPKYIQDVLAPMPELQLVPTGGVSLDNMHNFFDAGAAAVGVGGNLIDQVAVGNQDWDTVRAVAAEYVTTAKGWQSGG